MDAKNEHIVKSKQTVIFVEEVGQAEVYPFCIIDVAVWGPVEVVYHVKFTVLTLIDVLHYCEFMLESLEVVGLVLTILRVSWSLLGNFDVFYLYGFSLAILAFPHTLHLFDFHFSNFGHPSHQVKATILFNLFLPLDFIQV